MQIITYLFRIIAWFNNRLLAQTISTIYYYYGRDVMRVTNVTVQTRSEIEKNKRSYNIIIRYR